MTKVSREVASGDVGFLCDGSYLSMPFQICITESQEDVTVNVFEEFFVEAVVRNSSCFEHYERIISLC